MFPLGPWWPLLPQPLSWFLNNASKLWTLILQRLHLLLKPMVSAYSPLPTLWMILYCLSSFAHPLDGTSVSGLDDLA
jgi:hypothetical protein